MTATWDAAKISSLLSAAFAPHLAAQKASNTSAPTAAIDALITFDGAGVSSHPNHISLYHGARLFAGTLTRGKPGWAAPVDLYTLTTVGVWRKYAAFLDVFATVCGQLFGGGQRSDRGNPGTLVSMSALVGGGRESYGTARAAMTQAHQSQMVWFRWGWIALSRYMYINDLKLERVKS